MVQDLTYLRSDQIDFVAAQLRINPEGMTISQVLRLAPTFKGVGLFLDDLALLGGVVKTIPAANGRRGRIAHHYMPTEMLMEVAESLKSPETRKTNRVVTRYGDPHLLISEAPDVGTVIKLSLSGELVQKLFVIQNTKGIKVLDVISLALAEATAGIEVTRYHVKTPRPLTQVINGFNERGDRAEFLGGYECAIYPGQIIGSELFSDMNERSDARKHMAMGESRDLMVYDLDPLPAFDSGHRLMVPLRGDQMNKTVRCKVTKVFHPEEMSAADML